MDPWRRCGWGRDSLRTVRSGRNRLDHKKDARGVPYAHALTEEHRPRGGWPRTGAKFVRIRNQRLILAWNLVGVYLVEELLILRGQRRRGRFGCVVGVGDSQHSDRDQGGG